MPGRLQTDKRGMKMADIVLRCTDVSKAFGGVQALNKVDLTIEKGEIHCLAGGNGSGKSTLIKLISGFYKPDEGVIEIDGRSFQRLTPMEAIQQGVQVIYQDFSVFPNLTVAENIAITDEMASKRKLVNWGDVRRCAQEAIQRVGVDLPLNVKVEDLPVADKQLIAICRAILHQAKLIIMDEPTTALTRKEIDKLFTIIRRLQQQGVAILFVSHKLDEVFEIAERFTILRNGANVLEGNTADIDHQKFVYAMTGRNFVPVPFHPDIDRTAPPLLEVKGLGLKNGFADISFAVYPGEVLAIVGQLGCGRTELAKSLFGLYPADQGEIFVGQQRVVINSPQAAIRHKIAYVPEDRLSEGLALAQPISRNMAIANVDSLCSQGKNVDFQEIERHVETRKDELSIKMQRSDAAIQTLSGGNQQKVVLAKWLEIHPKVLVLNGPTVGVDVGAKYDLHNYLHSLAATKESFPTMCRRSWRTATAFS